MRQGIGAYATLNIVIIYIIAVISLLVATLNYYKGYKVNSGIDDIISDYEGYNASSKAKIDEYLASAGYTPDSNGPKCRDKNGVKALDTAKIGGHTNYAYCIYKFDSTNTSYLKSKNLKGQDTYYTSYGITTYIYIDIPLMNLKIPVYTKGARIFDFTGSGSR